MTQGRNSNPQSAASTRSQPSPPRACSHIARRRQEATHSRHGRIPREASAVAFHQVLIEFLHLDAVDQPRGRQSSRADPLPAITRTVWPWAASQGKRCR